MAELKTSIEGAVATVIFSNLPKMNAMSYDMWQAVPKVFAELERNRLPIRDLEVGGVQLLHKLAPLGVLGLAAPAQLVQGPIA